MKADTDNRSMRATVVSVSQALSTVTGVRVLFGQPVQGLEHLSALLR